MLNYFLAGVDIGGTKVTVSISDKQGIKIKGYQPVKLEGEETTIPRQIDLIIKDLCIGVGITQLDGIGVSTCSPFTTKDNQIAIVAPNLCGGLGNNPNNLPNTWKEIPLESFLTKDYRNVRIENDCVSAVIAERQFGAFTGERNLVYVTWSTGIGMGAYADGRIIRGKNSNALHGGHMFITEEGPLCNCGNFADLESLVSGKAIAKAYHNDAETEDVFLAYRRGDIKAKEIIERSAKLFARGLANINMILDTSVFVIGGSVFLNNSDILLPLIRDEFYKSFPVLTSGVKIEKSELGNYLGDLAALSLVMPDLLVSEWQKNKPWLYAPKTIILE